MTDQLQQTTNRRLFNMLHAAEQRAALMRRVMLLAALAGTGIATGASGMASGLSVGVARGLTIQEQQPDEPAPAAPPETPASTEPPAKIPELPTTKPSSTSPPTTPPPGAAAPGLAPGTTSEVARRPGAAPAPAARPDAKSARGTTVSAKQPESTPPGKPASADERAKERESKARKAAEMAKAKREADAKGGGGDVAGDDSAQMKEGAQSKEDADSKNGAATDVPGARFEQMSGSFRYGPFAEPVKIKLIADEVASFLGIQYIGSDAALADKVVFLPTAIDVPAEQLMEFLGLLLEQNGMVLKSTGIGKIYQISSAADVGAAAIGENPLATTQIIPTPGIKPSSLQQAIAAMATRSGGGGGVPGQSGGQVPGQAGPIAYLDELGVILITDSPRRIAVISSLVRTLVAEQNKQQFTRFDVQFLSAASARQRVIDLLGRGSSTGSPQQGQPQGLPGGGSASTTIANLPDRLTLEPTSNALLFRGRTDETTLLGRLLTVVDVPSVLEGKWYPVAGAAQIAQSAEKQGFGRVITIQTGNSQNGQNTNQLQPQQLNLNPGQTRDGDQSSGPSIVVDGQGRGFMYFATPTLHEQMDKLVKQLEPFTESESVVYEHYKVKHSKAEDIAELVRSLISNTVPAATSALLPGGGQNSAFSGSAFGNNNANNVNNNRRDQLAGQRGNTQRGNTGTGADGENAAIEASQDVFVLADTGNSQVIVKAPKRLQPQFARLITKLDLRRPQVFIEAQIIVLDDTNNWRLAFETQYVQTNGDGTTIAARSIFGDATAAAAGGLIGAPAITPLRNAFTAAVIKSDQVPLVITALQSVTNARIVAAPKLLVDDNEESEISALRQIPTTTTSQSGAAGSTVTAFGGFEDAGPRLRVKPQISSGDYLRLEYALELSSFLEAFNPDSPVPPTKSTTTITSDSVTVPSDSTIVVGGLTLENVSKTVRQIPLIGDIPILGQLFRDESENKNRQVIYVFITPRVMRDVEFNDVRLLSQGPLKVAKVSSAAPDMMPTTFIESIESARRPEVTPPARQTDPNEPTPRLPAPTTTPPITPVKQDE